MADLRDEIAGAIANARGMRRGAPPIVNVLELLPESLREQVRDDADNVLATLEKGGYRIVDHSDDPFRRALQEIATGRSGEGAKTDLAVVRKIAQDALEGQ